MKSLRPGFAGLAAVLLVAAVALQYYAVEVSRQDSGGLTDGLPNSYVVLTVMSTLSGFCVAVAIALVVGIIASLVIQEAVQRLALRADPGDSDESAALAAYGSDPELL